MDVIDLALAKSCINQCLEGQGALKGQDGFSPTITENADNTDEVYKLDIQTKTDKITTPNLKGEDAEQVEIIHKDLSSDLLTGTTTALSLINKLVTQFRTEQKPIRYINGSVNKTTLTDLPCDYGLLNIVVAGYDAVSVTMSQSSYGFKKMYHGYVNRTSSENLFSSLTWEKVATESDLTNSGSGTSDNPYFIINAELIPNAETNSVTFDKTFAEIKEAFDAGKMIQTRGVISGDSVIYVFNLLYASDDSIAFDCMNSAGKSGLQININSDDSAGLVITQLGS